jgi:hypothetical protein
MTKDEAHAAANKINRQSRNVGIPLSTKTMAFPMWRAKEGWTVGLPQREA